MAHNVPPDDIWRDHQTSTATNLPTATVRTIVSDNDAVKDSFIGWGQLDGELLKTFSICEKAIRMRFDPPLGSVDLICRLLHGPTKPPTPIQIEVAGVGKATGFVRENQDVFLEDDQ